MTPSIYINLEDDVSAIAARLKREKSRQVVLVCPKRCFLFSDAINLKLLKQQADLMGKEIFILTMDEKGRGFAQAAGFGLRDVPQAGRSRSVSDFSVRPARPAAMPPAAAMAQPEKERSLVDHTVKGLKNFAQVFHKDGAAEPAGKAEAVSQPRQEQGPVAAAVPQAHYYKVPHKEVVVAPTLADVEVPGVAVRDSIFPKEVEERIKAERRKKTNHRLVGALVSIALLVLLAVVFVVLPRATVTVYPKTEPVARELSITAGVSIQSPNLQQLTLSAVKITENLQASDKFEAQGKQEIGSKSDGTVKIYNFTKLPINLKASTTVLSVNGQNYTLVPDQVQIKPTKYSNPQTKEVDPASVGDSIEIVAVQGGESSNLPAGTRLEISNQVFGSKPQFLYAKTDTPVTGGVSRFLSVVSQQDVTSAGESLKQNILSQLRGKLAAEGLLLLDNAYAVQISSFTTDKLAGAQSPTFSGQMTATVTGLAFKKSELAQLIFGNISQSLPAGKTLQPDQDLESSYKIKSIDLNAQTAVIVADFQSKAIYSVDIKDLPQQLVGKTETQVDEILMSKPEIDRIDVTLAPSWQKTFPWFASKIIVSKQD